MKRLRGADRVREIDFEEQESPGLESFLKNCSFLIGTRIWLAIWLLLTPAPCVFRSVAMKRTYFCRLGYRSWQLQERVKRTLSEWKRVLRYRPHYSSEKICYISILNYTGLGTIELFKGFKVANSKKQPYGTLASSKGELKFIRVLAALGAIVSQ